MITELRQIIESSNPNYIVEFEENAMMNIKADSYPRDNGFAYIEEYVQGSYSKERFFRNKIINMQIYFCKFTEMHNNAIERERLRELIEMQIVQPFMKKYNESGVFQKVHLWKFYTPLPRFDANEVSIMLQFDCKKIRC